MLDKDDFLESISNRINSALRVALESDPANKGFIEKLNGARILVNCTAPILNLLIKIEDSEIALHQISFDPVSKESQTKDPSPVDLTLSATAISLTRLLTTPMENAAGLSDATVSVSGDVGLLLQLSQVAKMIEIDWERLVAERIGETPAVLLSRVVQLGLTEAKKFQQDLSQRFQEKVQSSDSPVPNQHDLSSAKSDLRELGYRLDRLEAKLSIIRQNKQ